MTTFLLIGQTTDNTLCSLVQIINNCVPEAVIEEFDTHQKMFTVDACSLDSYDLILLDYNLGQHHQNGLLLTQTLLKKTGCPPLILLLDNTENSNIAINALRIGAANYIIKSEINIKNILIKITETLDMFEKTADTLVTTSYGNQDIDFLDLTSESLNDADNYNNKVSIPGYTILKEIAKGGMSTVLLAKSEEDEGLVILKVMFLTGEEDKQSLKRFIQEYNLISHLVHPHVIRIHERAFAADFAYIAMDYLQNGDLSARIRKGITPEKALEYLHQMAMGIEAVHRLNIVHRDLKPGNILFNDDDTLVITDFGAAKIMTDDATDITVGNDIVGTPYYFSPEQGSGLKIDKRSDLYSLGVIFHEMLTGNRPYKAKSIVQLIQAHLKTPIPILKGNLAPYQPLMDGLLAKDPDERFQNASELIMGIEWITKRSV